MKKTKIEESISGFIDRQCKVGDIILLNKIVCLKISAFSIITEYGQVVELYNYIDGDKIANISDKIKNAYKVERKTHESIVDIINNPALWDM